MQCKLLIRELVANPASCSLSDIPLLSINNYYSSLLLFDCNRTAHTHNKRTRTEYETATGAVFVARLFIVIKLTRLSFGFDRVRIWRPREDRQEKKNTRRERSLPVRLICQRDKRPCCRVDVKYPVSWIRIVAQRLSIAVNGSIKYIS